MAKLLDFAAKPATMEIKHPQTLESFDPPIFIKVVGTDSDAFQRELIQLKKDIDTNKDLDIYTRTTLFLAKCIVGWDEQYNEFFMINETDTGAYSPKFVIDVLSNDGLQWFRKQVDEFVAQRDNFFQKPSIN